MKKSHLPLAIILSVLITVILIATVALVILLSTDGQPNNPDGSTTTTPEAGVTTTKKPTDSTTTQPAATTTQKPPATTTAKPTPTTKPAPVIKPTTTPKPPQTNKPETPTPTPGLSEISGTVKGDSIESLGIFAEYVTEEIDQSKGTIKLRFTFYLQSYGLRIGARADNYLVANGETHKKLSTAKIDLPDGSPLTRTELYEYVVEIQKTDDNTPVPLELEYFWHFQGSYSGQRADWLSVKVELSI